MSSYHYSFYSPTDFTAWVFSHRFHCLLRIFSHRFHRFTQNFLLRMFSHRFHRFTQKLGCLQGGALVSARLCRLPEQEVHQPRSAPTKQNRYSPTESTEPTELLAECILPQISQIYTEVRLPSRGCTCLRSALPLARARSAPTKKCTNQAKSIFSHGIHRTHRTSCRVYSPTDCTD